MIGNKKIIALCVARIQDDATNAYITALHSAIAGKGYNIFVYNTSTAVGEDEYFEDVQRYVYDYIDYDVVDVMLVFEEVIQNEQITQMLIERAKESNVPIIVIGKSYEGCVNVKFDHANGFAQIVRHIVCEHKMTNLHFMAGVKGNSFSDLRIDAFREVLEENNLPFSWDMVSYGDFWTDPTERETIKIIESGKLPQAIICANDKMAIAVCNTLMSRGIRVPEDVAVTGFDNILEVLFTNPRITTVNTDYVDLANKTAEILAEISQWKNKTETFLVPLRVCIGQSCGCDGEKTVSSSEYLIDMNDRFYRYQDEDIVLSQLIAKMQRSDNVEQIIAHLRSGIFYEMCCVVEKECLNETLNPTQNISHEGGSDRDMYLLFASEEGHVSSPYIFPVKRVVPALQDFLKDERVLVFSALHHLNVVLGYACFYYKELIMGNYAKIPQIMNALNNSIGGFRSSRHKQYLMNRINEMYNTDTLTGLRNRRGFEVEYKQMLDKKQPDESLTVMLVDLDGLKYINDNFGHKEGDYAIHAVALAMKLLCPEGSIFTRFGGDEMLAVCLGKRDMNQIKTTFYGYFDDLNAVSQKKYDVLASMGVYHTEEGDDLSFEGIIEKADVLMYMEKTKRKKQRVK